MADENHTPNYTAKKCKQLHALLKKRKVANKDFKRKDQLVAALQENDVAEYQSLLETVQERGPKVTGTSFKDLREAIRQEDVEKARHLALEERRTEVKGVREVIYTYLFQREFKAEPTRSSLMDLPAEVRVMVYKSLFDQPALIADGMKIEYDPVSDGFWKNNYEYTEDFHSIRNALNTLGTLNKTIRKEARATFWSLAGYHLRITTTNQKP